MAPGPLATIVAVAVFCLSPWPLEAGSFRIVTAGCQEPAGPSPAPAVVATPAASPAAAPPPDAGPPPPEGPPPPPPCPNQPPPALPVDEAVEAIKRHGDFAVDEVNAYLKTAATTIKEQSVAGIHGAADSINPQKNPVPPEVFAAEATGPLQAVKAELKSNFVAMHEKAQEEAAEVLDKVKVSIHNATRTTVEATVAEYEKNNEEHVKHHVELAAQDSNHSLKLADEAMEAVQHTMEAAAKLQEASDSLPQEEIQKALVQGKKAQQTSAMFTKQAIATKHVIEQYMILDYQSHGFVVLADKDQGYAYDTASKAEAQAATNSADIKVLTAAVKEAREEVVQALKKTSKLGEQVQSKDSLLF